MYYAQLRARIDTACALETFTTDDASGVLLRDGTYRIHVASQKDPLLEIRPGHLEKSGRASATIRLRNDPDESVQELLEDLVLTIQRHLLMTGIEPGRIAVSTYGWRHHHRAPLAQRCFNHLTLEGLPRP